MIKTENKFIREILISNKHDVLLGTVVDHGCIDLLIRPVTVHDVFVG